MKDPVTEAIPRRGVSRRDFGKFLSGAALLGLVEPLRAANLLSPDPKRLSFRAFRTAGAEGAWVLDDVEGEVPKELFGTLYRVAPGESERFGVTFNHLFDGDAFVSGFSFDEGKVHMRANFVALPERAREREAGEMLYSEFGTRAPADGAPRYKNSPSVNVIPWDGRLLGLSEGGPPTAIDPETLAFQSRWDFHGTLDSSLTFTAHPRFDPVNGVGYSFGTVRGPSMALVVHRMEPDGKLTELWRLPQRGYFMIHDMLFAGEWLVFVIPPVRYDVMRLMSGQATPGQAAAFDGESPLRILLLKADGSGKPVTVELPPNMVFHHGNAWTDDEGRVVFDTLLSPDGSILEALMQWSKDRLPEFERAKLTRFVVDPANGEVVSRDVLGDDCEFPRFDERLAGQPTRWLYAAEFAGGDDHFAANELVRYEHGGKELRVQAADGQAFGEPVFVPRDGIDGAEDDGWLLHLGYDGGKDRTFLDVRDAATLDRLARVWTPSHFPLGFHGNFTDGALVRPPE